MMMATNPLEGLLARKLNTQENRVPLNPSNIFESICIYICISYYHDQQESCPSVVGEEGAVLVEDEDEAEHGEGGEEEEEEIPEEVRHPEGGRVETCHDLDLLRVRCSLADR